MLCASLIYFEPLHVNEKDQQTKLLSVSFRDRGCFHTKWTFQNFVNFIAWAYFVPKLLVRSRYLQYKLAEPGYKRSKVNSYCLREVRKIQSKLRGRDDSKFLEVQHSIDSTRKVLLEKKTRIMFKIFCEFFHFETIFPYIN